MFYFVYIAECVDGSLYCGVTNNLEKRMKAHNELKSGAKYTKSRRPIALKYFEKANSRGEALQREAEIKKMPRQEKIKLIASSVDNPA